MHLEPGQNTRVMEDVFTLEYPDYFPFDEPVDADGALFIRMSNFHLLDFIYMRTKPMHFFLDSILFHAKLHRVFKHKLMELLCWHPMYRWNFRRMFPIILSIGDILPFILPIDEVQVVGSFWIELDWPVTHELYKYYRLLWQNYLGSRMGKNKSFTLQFCSLFP